MCGWGLYCPCISLKLKAPTKNWRWWWTRHFLNKGNQYEENLLADWKPEDGAGFRNFFRMTPSDFEILLQVIGSRISGTGTKYGAVIPLSIKLAVMRRYLATGESFTNSLLQRTRAFLGIHQFLGFSAKLRVQRLYFLLYLTAITLYFVTGVPRINFALLYLT
jgi:hypothetical protein